jgi:2-hydroxychromene-2-carboxylate isomerase
MAKVCEYYFSSASPYTYLGHAAFVALAHAHQVQIVLKPFDLGRVFSVSGGLPLSQRPVQRQNYRLIELQRWSEFRQLPLTLQPKFFPVSADLAGRLVVAAQLAHGTEAALPLIGAISHALWADEANIADETTLGGLANGLGLDGAALLKVAQGANAQATLAQHTDDAIAAGVFGSPWYVYEGQPYWGQDRLDFLGRAFAR